MNVIFFFFRNHYVQCNRFFNTMFGFKMQKKKKKKKMTQKGGEFRQELCFDNKSWGPFLHWTHVCCISGTVLSLLLNPLNAFCDKHIKFAENMIIFFSPPDRFSYLLQVPENNLISPSAWEFLRLPLKSRRFSSEERCRDYPHLAEQPGLFSSRRHLNRASAPWVLVRGDLGPADAECPFGLCPCRWLGTQKAVSHQRTWPALTKLASPDFYCWFLKRHKILANFPPVLTFSYWEHGLLF